MRSLPGMSIDKLTVQIDKLLAEHSALRSRSRYDDLSDLKDESLAFVVRLRAAIERFAPTFTVYAKEMNSAASDKNNTQGHLIQVYLGILRAIRADVEEGWIVGLAELLHADTFSDLIEQADELASKLYKDAAAVVIGSVLEAHLRLLCQKYGVNTQLQSG